MSLEDNGADRADASECDTCGLDQDNEENISGHDCLRTIGSQLRQSSRADMDNDHLLRSMNLLIAKLISDNQRTKEDLKSALEQIGELRSEFKDFKDQVAGQATPTHKPPSSLESSGFENVSRSHEDLISALREEGQIESDKVFQVMMSVDFRDFDSGAGYLNKGWQSNKVRFFERYATRVKEGSKVLYVFSNAYIATCLALLVGPQGVVVSEGDSAAVENVRKSHKDLLDTGRLVLVDNKWSDVFRKGYQKMAPYDVIIVGRHYFTMTIEQQLKVDGTAYDPWDDNRLN